MGGFPALFGQRDSARGVGFGFRISGFGFLSDFVFRTSDFSRLSVASVKMTIAAFRPNLLVCAAGFLLLDTDLLMLGLGLQCWWTRPTVACGRRPRGRLAPALRPAAHAREISASQPQLAGVEVTRLQLHSPRAYPCRRSAELQFGAWGASRSSGFAPNWNSALRRYDRDVRPPTVGFSLRRPSPKPNRPGKLITEP